MECLCTSKQLCMKYGKDERTGVPGRPTLMGLRVGDLGVLLTRLLPLLLQLLLVTLFLLLLVVFILLLLAVVVVLLVDGLLLLLLLLMLIVGFVLTVGLLLLILLITAAAVAAAAAAAAVGVIAAAAELEVGLGILFACVGVVGVLWLRLVLCILKELDAVRRCF